MIYWEPAWQSSSCWTAWGHGSHYENATFFDFQNNLLAGGGIDFLNFPYLNLSAVSAPESKPKFRIRLEDSTQTAVLELDDPAKSPKSLKISFMSVEGALLFEEEIPGDASSVIRFKLPDLPSGVYFCMVYADRGYLGVQQIILGK